MYLKYIIELLIASLLLQFFAKIWGDSLVLEEKAGKVEQYYMKLKIKRTCKCFCEFFIRIY